MRLRSAIFLDFDNVFISLQSVNQAAAMRFANAPGNWVSAMSDGRLLPFASESVAERAILAMRCYANPRMLDHYQCRASFTRAGFSVIDCPELTKQGKNSADIHMVLDAIELLKHDTRFDEFIIMSADADFTPLLTKLRTHDRRTAVFSNQATSAAYKAVASDLLDIEDLVEFLRGWDPGPTASKREPAPEPVPGEIDHRLADRIATAVESLVRASSIAIPLAQAAQHATAAVGGDNGRWAGYRSFGRLLQERLDRQLRFLPAPNDFVYDPARHAVPEAGEAGGAQFGPQRLGELPEDLRDFTMRLRQITDCPILTSEEFRQLFELFAAELDGEEFNLGTMSARVRDEFLRRETPIGRGQIGFVMKGVTMSGADLGESPSPETLADAYCVSLSSLCAQAGWELSEADLALLSRWVCG